MADGFYEWQRTGSRKKPRFIRLKEDQPFAFAGLWDRWQRNGSQIESCTILTTDSNDLLQPIHGRMPVILPPDDYGVWLDPQVSGGRELQPLLKPFPPEYTTAFPVSTVVNNPAHDVADCVAPAEQLSFPLGA